MKFIIFLIVSMLSTSAFAQCQMQPLQGDLSIRESAGRMNGVLQYRITCHTKTKGRFSVNTNNDGSTLLQGQRATLHASVFVNGAIANQAIELEADNTGQLIEVMLVIDTEGKRVAVDNYHLDFEATFDTL